MTPSPIALTIGPFAPSLREGYLAGDIGVVLIGWQECAFGIGLDVDEIRSCPYIFLEHPPSRITKMESQATYTTALDGQV